VKARAGGTVIRYAAPLRALAQRFSFLLLILAATALMMIGKVDTVLVEGLRARITDAFAPILDVIARPAAGAANFLESASDVFYLRSENQRLRQENATLLQWHQAALRLEAENRSLRNLLNFKPELASSYITARVVADPGGAFVRMVVVTAGRREGVRTGLAAVTGQGLIGRVVEVGDWSSRVLLITDLNAHIPVLVEPSRQRVMMVGDNSEQPRLLYTPPDAELSVGDRVVTSGHGGLLPPGLPVGRVAEVTERGIRVQPFTDLSRVEHIQLVDFGLPGGIVEETAKRSGTR
jgi:rod shape-determining protein MreC